VPRVLNRRHDVIPNGAVSISRPSKWGNPYRYEKGELANLDWNRELARYEEYVRSKPELMAALGELVGKDLVCWCKPDPCHGDVLLALVAEFELKSKTKRK
jgi:hypothetical protein